jgi:exodeoxyribonuclease-5
MLNDNTRTPAIQGGATPKVRLTPEQQQIVDAIRSDIDGGADSATLGGYGGTGKTTCIRHLIDYFPHFAVCAPTGRAASVLRRKGIAGASTIHSLMYFPIPACHGACQKIGKPCKCRIIGWKRRDLLEYPGVIVDEASMVSRKLHRDLMSYGVQAVFVGDHGQLPPVLSREERQDGLPTFSLMADPDYKLEHIHRNAGDIAWFAQHLREGRWASQFRPRTDAVVITREPDKDRLPILESDQIICASNRTRVGLNQYVRKRLGRNGLIEVGERVMCLKNDHDKTTLCNGTLATVTADYPGDRTFDLDSEEGAFSAVPYDPERFNRVQTEDLMSNGGPLPFDYGYASTCHKSQGGEWPTVLVFEEWMGYLDGWDQAKWNYTAASRAQDRLVWRIKPFARKKGGDK